MRRSPLGSIAASPTMVGAVTVLIAIVAVFLAYNANSGLPFVPVYRVSVEVPNAARVTANNEVRIGGHRVGVVESIDAIQEPEAQQTAQTDGEVAADNTGGAIARLNLKLEKDIGPLPKDSVFRVRYRSAFGLKYLDITRGTGEGAPEGFTFDGTDDGESCALPLDPATFSEELPDTARNGCFVEQTEFDAIADTFDTETRENARRNLIGFGDAFAARGTSLNDAISSLEPLFEGLKPVSRVLSDEGTRLRRLFPELADAARIVAPVATEQSQLFTNAAITLAAISSDVTALQETIVETWPTFETGIELLPRQRPFLRDVVTLTRELRPGVTDLRATLPVLNRAIEVGTPVLAESPRSTRLLEDSLRELNQLVSQPTTRVSLQRLEETFGAAYPLAQWVVPAQTVCNYWNYWFTFTPNGLSDTDGSGYTFRQDLTNFPPGFEVEAGAASYAGVQANGKLPPAFGGTFEPYALPILNAHPYQPTGQKNADCQGGQSGYELGALRLPGQAASNPANGVSDLPGSRGPTTLFYNADQDRALLDTRVPSRAPETWKGIGK